MAFCTQSLIRRISTNVKKYATALEMARIPEEPIQSFRTLESNPVNHCSDHLGRFYTVPEEVRKEVYTHNCIPKEFQKNIRTFTEFSMLVRKPALEIISYLRQADYTRPINKYILYGEFGHGKSITLTHLIHYGFMAERILVHLPWAPQWFKFPKEISASSKAEGYVDLPVDAATWLARFKTQNFSLMPKLDLRISKDYTWNVRESTKQGSPLMELVDFGINRVKYACEVIDVLFNELKAASTAGKCNTLVLVDGYNAFFSEFSDIRVANRVMIKPEKVTLTDTFKNIVKHDWCNGAVILTVDDKATKERRDSILPRYLLTKEGFELLDPFVPIYVDRYNPQEFETVIEYYKNRKWIREITKEGEKELELMSNRNPQKLMEYCTNL